MSTQRQRDPVSGARGNHRILLLISAAAAYGREAIKGIVRYNELNEGWQLLLGPADSHAIPNAIRDAHGIIAEARHRDTLERLEAFPKPVVLVTGQFHPGRIPMVVADNTAAGRLAADYLAGLGLRHLAFVGEPRTWFSRVRCQAFAARGRELGLPCRVFLRRRLAPADLHAWLWALPRPVGLLAMNLDTAKSVSDACRETGLRVPEDVAILGIDRDDITARLSVPPLSTLDLGVDRIGTRAAELLAHLLAGGRAPDGPIVVSPVGVIERQSTDTMAVEDPDIGLAIRAVRQQAVSAVPVRDMLRHLTVSRRKIEIGFRRVLGRTVEEEVRRVRIEAAKRLLRGSELPMAVVAQRAGLSSNAYMANVFRRELGLTPGDYRRGTVAPEGA